MDDILTPERFAELRERRASDPTSVITAVSARSRRQLLRGDGRLFIVAADHPARGALKVGSNPIAMANRYDLLERLAIALSRPGVDGVLGTPDILEDLAALGMLDNRVAVGSVNRGGIAGSTFEMDDRVTAYDIDGIVAAGLDFAKILLRIDLDDPATAGALERAAQLVSRAAAAQVPIMIEPFMSQRVDNAVRNILTTDAVTTSVAISSGLGATSAYTWLKLPVVAQMDQVLAATTLPVLLLGGDACKEPDEVFASWADALVLPGVRGLVVGRSILYPETGDVAAAVDRAARLVHGPSTTILPHAN